MFLNLIKIVGKNTLHQAAEEWAEEIGLPEPELVKMRERRLAFAEEALLETVNYQSCDRELCSLTEAVDEPGNVNLQVENDQTPDQSVAETVEIDDAFFQWVHRQRQSNMPWAVIAMLATEKGIDLSEKALARRYHRWCQQNGE